MSLRTPVLQYSSWPQQGKFVASDRRKHRGPHPRDPHLFSDESLPSLRQATSDLSWLLGKGYAIDSSVKLVGDRYKLRERQRIAIKRAACSDDEATTRGSRRIELREVRGRLLVDGFNVIVTVEAALSGGVLLRCRDGAIRDLASVHGSYRKVDETAAAIGHLSVALRLAGITEVLWLLDRPVSNSGTLAKRLRAFGEKDRADWEVMLVDNPDDRLIASDQPVATADSYVLDQATTWVNLASEVVERIGSDAWIIEL